MMYQVYCDDEYGVNKWLKEQHGKIEVTDIKISSNDAGEIIMVIYKTNEYEVSK